MAMTVAETSHLSHLKGRFIVLDGPDGCGKSTQLRLLADACVHGGLDVQTCRDPGGTAIGVRIRDILLGGDLPTMDAHCEVLLFMASRAQLCSEVVRPALARGATVLCDRFVSATCAYQGALGVPPRQIIELAEFAVAGTWPDATVILDVDVDLGLARVDQRHAERAGVSSAAVATAAREAEATAHTLFGRRDAMESRSVEFHGQVRKQFLDLPSIYPTPIIAVDGSAPVEAVHQRIIEGLASCRFQT
ncbi:MAG: dTMP kinase [Phycisphaerales bacterium]|nr:MAG: dTMP kinase [Phycisphaerales bacterium]